MSVNVDINLRGQVVGSNFLHKVQPGTCACALCVVGFLSKVRRSVLPLCGLVMVCSIGCGRLLVSAEEARVVLSFGTFHLEKAIDHVTDIHVGWPFASEEKRSGLS